MNLGNLYYIKHMAAQMASFFPVKIALSLLVGFIIYAIGDDNCAAAEALLFLIVADFSLAWISAYYRGEAIQSAKALRTGIKMVVYFLLVSSAHVAKNPTHLPFLDDTVIAFLALTELISVLEHGSELGFSVPKRLLNQLRTENE